MRSIVSICAAAAVAMLLAGCASNKFVVGPLPKPEARLTKDYCGHRAARPGEHARVVAKRFNAERRCEKGRADAWMSFYAGLQINRGSKWTSK